MVRFFRILRVFPVIWEGLVSRLQGLGFFVKFTRAFSPGFNITGFQPWAGGRLICVFLMESECGWRDVEGVRFVGKHPTTDIQQAL